MNWKLWIMSKIVPAPTGVKNQGQGSKNKPKDLPQEVGRYLVVEKGLDPDWVWGLKYVRKSVDNSKTIFDFRVFNPVDAGQQNFRVTDFDSLDGHTDLILFEGRHDKENREVEMA